MEAVAKCTKLESLNLSGNKLAAVSDLAPLASLESLSHLELNNCELASIENYRKEVFGALPHLKFLDGLDQEGQEEKSDAATKTEGTNGVSNGHTAEGDAEAGDEDEADGSDEEEDDDEEEEIGISALQGSAELDDDEEDYVPGRFLLCVVYVVQLFGRVIDVAVFLFQEKRKTSRTTPTMMKMMRRKKMGKMQLTKLTSLLTSQVLV